MKKLYSTSAWAKKSKLRQRKAKKRRKRQRARARAFRATRASSLQVIRAPECFSLILDTESTTKFLQEVASRLRTRNAKIMIDFTDVTTITPEASMALIAIMDKSDKNVRGNMPTNAEAGERLIQSGFFHHVKHKSHSLKKVEGRIAKLASTSINTEQVRELIRFGTEALYGTPTDSEASYLVLVEAMENTIQHSADFNSIPASIYEPERWWAVVFADKQRQRICFAIFDTGVGIFRSAKLKWLRRMDVNLRRTANASLLRDMMEGRIGSRTGESHRGKGLPSIRNACVTRQIRELVVITNSVRADIEREEYVTLRNSFGGTLLYWEIQK